MKRTLLTLALIAAAGTAGAQTVSSTTQMNTQMSSGANTSTAPARMAGAAGTAQKRIEMDGYKNVQGLAKGSDGLWHGTAMRGSSQVQVTVDRTGNVSAQ